MVPMRSLFATLLFTISTAFAQDGAPVPVPNATPVPTPALISPPAPTPTPTPKPAGPPPLAIEIDLSEQKAWVLQDGQRIYETAISSGRSGHETPTGEFTVLEKDIDHKSSLYGRIVDGQGRTLIPDADDDMAVPAGGKFVQAPMAHFLRFDGPIGMHAGRLPGYPASHGCIRLPPGKAALFYNIAELGTPVRIFGKAPRTGPPVRPKAAATPLAAASPTPKPKFPWFRRL